MDIRTKRVYDAASDDDGFRVLVDRLWPRGMTKDRLQAAAWMKDVAPSTDLRKWYKKHSGDWGAFKARYFRELDDNPESVAELKRALRDGRVTLLYAAQDTERNHALALIEYLGAKP